MNSHWENTTTKDSGFRTRDYRCAYCGRDVAASEGYWCIGEHDSLEHTIAICPKCNGPTFFRRHLNQIPQPPFGDSVPHIDEPKIEAIYEEARQCTSDGAFTAAVMLCRKLLMNIAVRLGAPENQSFQAYVTYLDEKGYVPPNGKKWVDAIRQKGNEANHEIRLMDEKDARNIIRFSEMLLRFIFEIPNIYEESS
jgi:hypothetical protein